MGCDGLRSTDPGGKQQQGLLERREGFPFGIFGLLRGEDIAHATAMSLHFPCAFSGIVRCGSERSERHACVGTADIPFQRRSGSDLELPPSGGCIAAIAERANKT